MRDYEDLYVSAFGQKIPIRNLKVRSLGGGGFELMGSVGEVSGAYRYNMIWTDGMGTPIDPLFAEILTQILRRARNFMPV